FFSSRRRHTRWPRDWSSDVCSSDLLAQVSGDFRIGPPGERAAQVAERILQVAHPVQHPSHAVDDERIFGGELQRLFDQLARLGEALIAVGEGITERIVGVGVLGPYLDQLAKG